MKSDATAPPADEKVNLISATENGHEFNHGERQNPPHPFISNQETTIPPAGAPPGGVWGKQRFRGRLTAAATVGGVLVACIPGLVMLAFRLDERDAYLANDGKLYDTSGKPLGPVKKLKFIPDVPKMDTYHPPTVATLS